METNINISFDLTFEKREAIERNLSAQFYNKF